MKQIKGQTRGKRKKNDFLEYYQEFPYAYRPFKRSKMDATLYRRQLIADRKSIIAQLKRIGFSKKVAKELATDSIELARKLHNRPDMKELQGYLGNKINDFITSKKKKHFPAKFVRNKVVFLPGNAKETPVNKYYFLSLKADRDNIAEEQKFGELATKILTHASKNKLQSKINLGISHIGNDQVWRLLDDFQDEFDCNVEIDEIKTIENIVNDKFLIQEYVYPGNRFGACARFILGKKADKKQAKEIAKYVLMHIVDKNPLCTKKDNLPAAIIEIESKNKKGKIDNKKYNEFLEKSVLYEQYLTSDPLFYQYGDNKDNKKKIKVGDYLKEYDMDVDIFIRT